jgi:Aspartyl protease
MSRHAQPSGRHIPPTPAELYPWLLRSWFLRSWLHRGLALVLALLAPPAGPAQPAVVRLPFRSVQSMILVEGKVNGHTLTFLLDTGSLGTIVSTRVYGSQFPVHRIRRNLEGPGLSGESFTAYIDLELGNHRWNAQRVSIMNLDELSRIIGVKHIDGLVGEDLLREFRSVHINYQAHVIELEP